MERTSQPDGEPGNTRPAWRGPEPHPLDRDLAALSRDAYSDGPSTVPGWQLVPAAERDRMGLGGVLDDPASGFHARLYVHPRHGHVLAMRGSDDARDWATNLRQGFGGDDAQYRHAATAASRTRAALGGDLVLTGHSLGGGLAALASLRAGVPAVTFNAAGVHDRTLALHGISRDVRGFAAASGHVRHYTVENDIATALQLEHWRTAALLPDPIGHRIRLRDPDPLGGFERLLPGAALRHGLAAHAIDTVVCALDAPQPLPARPHPAARLLAQSVDGLRALHEARPDIPLSTDRFLNLSVSVAARAWEEGLRRIDRIAGNDDGTRLFAIEGDSGDPAHRRATIEAGRGDCEPAARSSAVLRGASLEHERALPAVPLLMARPEPEPGPGRHALLH